MKIRSERDKRNYLIIALCAILVVMGVGYAAFSSLLTINDTANISNSWCVGFDNTQTSAMQITKGLSTGTQPTGSMSYSGTACGSTLQPNSSLNAHFYQPGDQIEYTLTITNKSTVTAAIKSILVDNESVTSNTTKKKNNITYIVEMPETTTLAPNASTTMKIIARFQNETDVTGNVNGETQSIEVKINAEQDDGEGGMDITPAKFTGTIYRWNTKPLYNGLTMNGPAELYYNPSNYSSVQEAFEDGYWNVYKEKQSCGDTCQSGIVTLSAGQYRTEAEVPTYSDRVTTFGKNYYLKHDVEEDIITASYVCFVYNNAEHCMKGGDNGDSFDANTQMIKDYQSFNNLGDYRNDNGCDFYSNGSYCYSGIFYNVSSYSDGNVTVEGSSGMSCYINDNGYSRCNGL